MAKASPVRSGQLGRLFGSSGKVYVKLDDYQRNAVDLALVQRTLAVLFDQGTGKTWVAGGVIEKLLHETFSALLIVPLSNKTTTWRKFLSEHLPQVRVFEDLSEYVIYSGPKVILLHIDQFARATGKKLVARLRKLRFTLIVLDEAHRIKQRSSSWSRNIAKLRYCSIRKLILTGTPMDDQPIDLWAQFRFLRPNVFGTRWADFEEEFLEPVDNSELEGLKPGSFKWKRMIKLLRIRQGKRKFDMTKLPAFLERVSPWCTRITQDDLGWDKATFHKVPVDLSSKQRDIYDQLERRLVARLPRATITTPLKVTRLEKMRQVCGGWVIDEEKDVHVVGRVKLKALMGLIKEHVRKSPIVVFCKYTAEVDGIVDEIMRTTDLIVAKFSGKVGRNDRDEIQRLFQAGHIDVIVCQIKTGGVGIDLFRSNVGIMYSPVYSFIDFDQAIKRIKRRGQSKRVHIFLICARHTIDEDAFGAIVKKGNVTETVLRGIQERNKLWLTRSLVSPTSRSRSAFRNPPLARTSVTLASRSRVRPTNGAKASSTRS